MSDADSLNALDQLLVEDGRGMVLASSQVRGVTDERARIEKHLQNPGVSIHLVAVLEDGRVIANAKIQQFFPALLQHVGVIDLGVAPEFQGFGVGRAMMDQLLDLADTDVLLRLELYVREDNARAIKLYESLGFRHEAARKSFVRLPDGRFVNDLIMVKLHGEAM